MKMVEMMLFERPGNQNTADCVKLVAKHVKEHGRKHVVVASTSGKTAMAFHKALQNNGTNLVVVTHSVGFKEPGHDEFDPDLRRQLKKARVPIPTGTILTHSLEKSIMDSFRGIYPGYLIANTLRRFGEGTKVAMEIVMEACDAGPVSYTHLRAHETPEHLVCRLLLEKKKHPITPLTTPTLTHTPTLPHAK